MVVIKWGSYDDDDDDKNTDLKMMIMIIIMMTTKHANELMQIAENTE